MKKKLNCVLLIDDDEPTNFLSQIVVEEVNCAEKIRVATSGQKALDYLTDVEVTDGKFPCPDLIFLDVNMPAMNGWEFLDNYATLDSKHKGKIVIIMLTTSLNPDDRWRSESTPHVTGFENKPLTEAKLNDLLRKHFPENYV